VPSDQRAQHLHRFAPRRSGTCVSSNMSPRALEPAARPPNAKRARQQLGQSDVVSARPRLRRFLLATRHVSPCFSAARTRRSVHDFASAASAAPPCLRRVAKSLHASSRSRTVRQGIEARHGAAEPPHSCSRVLCPRSRADVGNPLAGSASDGSTVELLLCTFCHAAGPLATALARILPLAELEQGGFERVLRLPSRSRGARSAGEARREGLASHLRQQQQLGRGDSGEKAAALGRRLGAGAAQRRRARQGGACRRSRQSGQGRAGKLCALTAL
jgi:hypothetical protein